MKLVMFLGQVNHGITKEDAKKVASFLQLESKHSQKLMDETPENVRPSGRPKKRDKGLKASVKADPN